nr:phospholipase D-like domain-containing protein [Geomicrobium halophilum]
MLKYISAAEADSDIWLGAFYVSDRDIINALKEAADRGANVRLILDPNHEAFGREKIGVPNRPVADELQSYSDQIEVRWYNTNGEQYHTKMLYMTDGDEAMVNGGSSNFTRRNIDDLNLETNLLLVAPKNHAMMEDIEEYFHALWNNDGSHYTHDFSQHSEGEVWKYWLYRLQETTGLSSF